MRDNSNIEDLKRFIAAELEKTPNATCGKTIAFSNKCGLAYEFQYLTEFKNLPHNKILVMINPTFHGGFRILISANTNVPQQIVASAMRHAIREFMGRYASISFETMGNYALSFSVSP